MGLVNRVGRKQGRARVAMGVVYTLLTIGAITTLYPFCLMASYGLKGPTDQNDNRLVPAYFSETKGQLNGQVDPKTLLGKYLADKYMNDQNMIASTRIGSNAAQERVSAYEDFLNELPLEMWNAGFRTGPGQVTGRLSILYQSWLRTLYPSLDALNTAYNEQNGAFQQVVPPIERFDDRAWKPVQDRKWQEWLLFKARLPAEFRVPIRAQRLYQEWWRTQTKGRFKDIPVEISRGHSDFTDLPLVDSGPFWETFKRDKLPPRFWAETVEQRWNRTLREKEAPLPISSFEEKAVETQPNLRSEFATRNFLYVIDYVLLNGRILLNTIIFCLLAILVQLTVNPLAAYALSRYPVRASYKILLFLLATMAFPAEVAMIPSFLLLKDLGLLNTFAALVLPGAASGYMVFLLKGFFDSLPQELFEAGQLDGAKESTMMLRIALPLSRPVLGYMALLAFMGAYGAFMYAFLVAQDRRIWTLMVWIYQLQATAPKAVMMAALTLAALPTLVVFLLAQRVILKGIVLPGER